MHSDATTPLRRSTGHTGASPARFEPPAPCHGHTALWFSRDKTEIRAAQAICQTCPHRWPCLTGAIERDEKFGIWGGEDFAGLSPAALRQRRHRGRAS